MREDDSKYDSDGEGVGEGNGDDDCSDGDMASTDVDEKQLSVGIV